MSGNTSSFSINVPLVTFKGIYCNVFCENKMEMYRVILCMFCIKICLANVQVSDSYTNVRSARNRPGYIYERFEFSSLGFNQMLAPQVQCAFACSENSTCDIFYVEAGACVFGAQEFNCENGGTFNEGTCECAQAFEGQRCEIGNLFTVILQCEQAPTINSGIYTLDIL